MLKKALAVATVAGALLAPAAANAQTLCADLYVYVNGELVNESVCTPA